MIGRFGANRSIRRWAAGLLAAWVVAALLGPAVARAQYVLEDTKDPKRYGPGAFVLPFALYTKSLRFGAGVVFDTSGYVQPQHDISGLAFGSSNYSYGLQLGQENLQIVPGQRLFLDSELAMFNEEGSVHYLPGPQSEAYEATPGTNNSSKEDFFVTRDVDGWGNFTFKYLLPVGGGRDVVINHYVLEDGLLKEGATGGQGWNPLFTGRTYLELVPFFEYRTLKALPHGDRHSNTNGLRMGIVYDNTDFPLNASHGNLSRVTVSRDFGLFDTRDSWLTIDEEFTQYVDLGHTSLFRQQVLALDGWSSYCPTWDENYVGGVRHVANAPPFYEGAVLGGRDRLRGYEDERFHDRAAIYGSAELRLVPNWNPLGKIKLLKEADIAWMQFAIFGEVGRVANEYDPSILSHLKGDVGFGIRLLANDTLVRFDVAASSEGYSVWVNLGQPFSP